MGRRVETLTPLAGTTRTADDGRGLAEPPALPPLFSLLMPSFKPASVTQELLFHLARIPGAVHRDRLARAAGTSKEYAGRLLSEMVKLGRVERVGRGTYDLVSRA